MIIQLVLAGLLLLRLGWLCRRAASGRGRQSRLGWLRAAGETLLLMVVARVLLNWSMIPPLLWLLPVVIIAVITALVIRRWDGLPWVPKGDRTAPSVVWSVVGGATVVGVAGVLLA